MSNKHQVTFIIGVQPLFRVSDGGGSADDPLLFLTSVVFRRPVCSLRIIYASPAANKRFARVNWNETRNCFRPISR